MNHFLNNRTAIAGIGATEFSKESGQSEIQLAVRAVSSALDDAGLNPEDVDGMVTFTMDNNPEYEVFRQIGGREMKFFGRVHYGGGAGCGAMLQAAMALASGVCKVVVIYRALNERSGFRFGSGALASEDPNSFETAHFGWYMPFGLLTPASWIAMNARRYMHEYSVTSEDFGRVSVAARDFAATNPKAWFYQRPLTLEQHQNSRWIVEPLHLYDCCQETDGAVALVMVTAEHAQELQQQPVLIRAVAQGATAESQMVTGFYRDDITDLPEMKLIAKQLYAMSGLKPNDIDVAILYDHFTPFVLSQLEAFDFCATGKAAHFIRDGHISRGGKLPVNTHGGQIGEGYIHGLNGVSEGVRQLRGQAVNQIDQAEHVLVTSGPGLPTSAVILGSP